MAITSKTLEASQILIMLDSVFSFSTGIFTATNSADSERGSSSNVAYNPASGNSAVLSANAVISVDSGSTGADAVTKIKLQKLNNGWFTVYTITLSPAEEFQYQGTITITSATITLSGTMT